MKIKNTLILFAAILGCVLSSCEDEKDLIIIEGKLPIKTKTLYMVGNSTPNGWNIDYPTPLTPTEEDPLVFTWEGLLYQGEMKLCLTTGSWDAGFIRPEINGTEISKEPIVDATFDMHAGDPDSKWVIKDGGIYSLKFDLRNWTMSTTYVKGADAPVVEPIETEAVYMIGDATPTGWGIDNPTMLEKKSKYVFEYSGPLYKGELKCCLSTGDFNVPFIRPEAEGTTISRSGVAKSSFVYTSAPDNKWQVVDAGEYTLTFDLENWTIAAEYKGEMPDVEKEPIETESLFMIGDATPGGWSMDDASVFVVDRSDKYVFTWEGELVTGSLKACLERDGSFSCPFIRPASADVEINRNGVAETGFVFTRNPDDQWKVTEAGRYRITFNLKDWTIAVKCLTGDEPAEKDPLEAETLFMIGDATPGGWSLDKATPFTKEGYTFVWEGNLKQGELKACVSPDSFDVPFLRPSSADCKITAAGVEASDFVYTTGPDHKWKVETAGKYRLVFNLIDWTIEAKLID